MSIFLFLFENRGVYEIIWKKYFGAGGATDDDIAPAHCMLDIVCYKHTLRICITFFFHCNNWLHERASTLRHNYVISPNFHVEK